MCFINNFSIFILFCYLHIEVFMNNESLTYRKSIFATRPSHARVKTETDCIRQKETSQMEFFIKRPLRRQNISEFNLKFEQKTRNQTLTSKKLPAEKSLFQQIKSRIPKFKKQNISEIQFQHPLKQYINSAQKSKNLRKYTRKYKTSFCNPLIGTSKDLKSDNKLVHSTYQIDIQSFKSNCNKQNENLHRIIDEIYKKIGKFKQVGYTQKKINQWIQRYCLQKRKYMTPLLMKSSNKHKFSQTQQQYFYEKDGERVKQKLLKVIKKINGKQKPIDQYDLMQFSNYIQEILIQKNKMKILELKDSITQKLDQCFIYNRQRNQYQFGKKLHPPDVLNFVSDLNEVQAINGNFENISTFNRQYFADLGKTQKDIRSKIYELISITQNRTKKIQSKDLIKHFTFDFEKNQIKKQISSKNLQIFEVDDLQQC